MSYESEFLTRGPQIPKQTYGETHGNYETRREKLSLFSKSLNEI